MTLPSSGALAMSAFEVEIGQASGTAISMSNANIAKLVGKSSGQTISFSELYGRSSLSFSPAPGAISKSSAGSNPASVTITCSLNVAWNFTLTSGTAAYVSVNRTSGSYATSITFTASPRQSGSQWSPMAGRWTLSVTEGGQTYQWTITCSAEGTV